MRNCGEEENTEEQVLFALRGSLSLAAFRRGKEEGEEERKEFRVSALCNGNINIIIIAVIRMTVRPTVNQTALIASFSLLLSSLFVVFGLLVVLCVELCCFFVSVGKRKG